MDRWPFPQLIRDFYGDATFFAKQRYQYNYGNSYVEGSYWASRVHLMRVMIYAGVYDYYQHGNGD